MHIKKFDKMGLGFLNESILFYICAGLGDQVSVLKYIYIYTKQNPTQKIAFLVKKEKDSQGKHHDFYQLDNFDFERYIPSLKIVDANEKQTKKIINIYKRKKICFKLCDKTNKVKLWFVIKKVNPPFLLRLMLPLYIDERLEEYEKEFKLWLKPKHDLDLSKYYDEIKQCPNPICMHVRRGDSLYEWKKIKQEQIIDFYIREVNNFAKLNSESKCFIFSDDLVWCKKNFDKVLFNCKIVFCDAFSRQQAINEVFLMSKCKKFVTSYSQFAKLAYSLCEDKEKERVQLNLESKGISNSMF